MTFSDLEVINCVIHCYSVTLCYVIVLNFQALFWLQNDTSCCTCHDKPVYRVGTVYYFPLDSYGSPVQTEGWEATFNDVAAEHF